jgi:hypothetical protein
MTRKVQFIRKRQSESPKSKSQQLLRRRETPMEKSFLNIVLNVIPTFT